MLFHMREGWFATQKEGWHARSEIRSQEEETQLGFARLEIRRKRHRTNVGLPTARLTGSLRFL